MFESKNLYKNVMMCYFELNKLFYYLPRQFIPRIGYQQIWGITVVERTK